MNYIECQLWYFQFTIQELTTTIFIYLVDLLILTIFVGGSCDGV